MRLKIKKFSLSTGALGVLLLVVAAASVASAQNSPAGQSVASSGKPANGPAKGDGVIVFPRFGTDPMANQIPDTLEPWLDAKPEFKRIRKEVDAFAKARHTRAESRENYLARAKDASEKPTDVLAQYGWALAAWDFARTDPLIVDPNSTTKSKSSAAANAMWPANVALRNASPPREYEFSRLRFLFAVYYTHSSKLVPLGDRLIKREPADVEVLRYQLMIVPQETQGQQALALKYCDTLLKANPNEPNFVATAAATHMGIYFRTKSTLHRQQAIAGYRRYLALAAADDDFKEDAQIYLEMLTGDK